MRILVISDTHIPGTADKLPAVIENEAKASDCCFHCGDFISYSIFEALCSYTKVYGVRGNMDDEQIKKKLPEKQIIKFSEANLSIGIIHGGGPPFNLVDYVNKAFSDNFAEIDAFIFGHSHSALDKEINKRIYFNPGSPTDKVFAPYCSYGILELADKKIKRRIIKIE
jgi:putative phosphoesterase